jgi:3-methyladenine DNA glycosylase AlkD
MLEPGSGSEAEETVVAVRTASEVTAGQVMADLASLEDPKIRAVNERHGDDHGVNLTKLRGVAKRLGTQPVLSQQLWETGDTAARLVAILIGRPKSCSVPELDRMLRDARVPKVHDWLISYVVKKNPHVEALRTTWFADADPIVASAGWSLTSDRVAKDPDGLDLPGLLDLIEVHMKDAPDRLQWAMNECLAAIGIHHPEFRARAIRIGERLEVLKDYPTPPDCTSPYAPIWIAEIVRRQESRSGNRASQPAS